jgi:hypothetical protein
MARSPKAGDRNGEIKQGATYRVDLTKAIAVGRAFVRPGPRVLLSGDALAKLKADDPAAVESYQQV